MKKTFFLINEKKYVLDPILFTILIQKNKMKNEKEG